MPSLSTNQRSVIVPFIDKGKNQLLGRPAFSHPPLVQSQTPDQHIKTVQCPKQFILFFGDPVFKSQIKTKEELYRAILTLVSGSVLSHPSLVQSQTPDQRIKTVQYPKQFFPFFGGPSLCITDQD